MEIFLHHSFYFLVASSLNKFTFISQGLLDEADNVNFLNKQKRFLHVRFTSMVGCF